MNFQCWGTLPHTSRGKLRNIGSATKSTVNLSKQLKTKGIKCLTYCVKGAVVVTSTGVDPCGVREEVELQESQVHVITKNINRNKSEKIYKHKYLHN